MTDNQKEYLDSYNSYLRRLRQFADQLEFAANDNPVARAVCDHHSLDKEFGTFMCTGCIGNEYNEIWPCPTILVVADKLGIGAPIP